MSASTKFPGRRYLGHEPRQRKYAGAKRGLGPKRYGVCEERVMPDGWRVRMPITDDRLTRWQARKALRRLLPAHPHAFVTYGQLVR